MKKNSRFLLLNIFENTFTKIPIRIKNKERTLMIIVIRVKLFGLSPYSFDSVGDNIVQNYTFIHLNMEYK